MTNIRSRRIGLFFLLIILMLLPATSGSIHAADGIKWYSYNEGMTLGKSQQKKIFINFHADWCKYCKIMDKETFTNAEVVSYLNQYFISIKVDTERERNIARKFHINPLPDSWFLTETGEAIGNKPGYITADQMLPILKFISSDSYLKMTYRQFKNSL